MERFKIHMVADYNPKFPLCSTKGNWGTPIVTAVDEDDVTCKKCIKIMVAENRKRGEAKYDTKVQGMAQGRKENV